MLSQLETLLTLKKYETMTATSVALRVSQSTVSKRIDSLETFCGKKLIAKNGRRVELTKDALQLLEMVEPHLEGIQSSLKATSVIENKLFRVGVSDSIFSSWGGEQLSQVEKKSQAKWEWHCHRSPVVIEKVISGRFDLGICCGEPSGASQLVAESLGSEPMVWVGDVKGRLAPIVCIEKSSSTWRHLRPIFHKQQLTVDVELETFFAVAQWALSTNSRGLIPQGVSDVLKIKQSKKRSTSKLWARPIQAVFKKSRLDDVEFGLFIQKLKAEFVPF